jgi:hypothetical protein
MCPTAFNTLKYGAFKLTGLIVSKYNEFKLCSEGLVLIVLMVWRSHWNEIVRTS